MKYLFATGTICILLLAGFLIWNPFAHPSKIKTQNTCPMISDVLNRPFGDDDYNSKVETKRSGEYNDDILYDRDGQNKVAVREEWGGALVFFGADKNTLDVTDANRGVQVSFHDDARAFQGCAYNRRCLRKRELVSPPCTAAGWNPSQATDRSNFAAGIDGMVRTQGLISTFTPLQYNPQWNSHECSDGQTKPSHAAMRVTQSLRFVKSGILEIEYLITNLEREDAVANLGPRNDFPRIFAGRGDLNLEKPVNMTNGDTTEKRLPAGSSWSIKHLRAPGGWAGLQTADGQDGLGLYWENRNEHVDLEQNAGDRNVFRSNFAFTIPAGQDVRGRAYLILGGGEKMKALAQDLDSKLAPFGRIEKNQISEDTRTVHLSGWALDNKGVRSIELWVDGKKVADLSQTELRDDICTTYPGYSMCVENKTRVGFATTYARPAGTGCDRPVEVRATDTDGNSRIIARTSVSPVVY